MKRIRPARHYQHPRAPVRALADAAIPRLTTAFATALKSTRTRFDGKVAAYLIANGRWREVYGIIDWRHADEAMRRPLTMLGNVWLDGGEIGERKINGAFSSRGRKVRFTMVRKDQADLFNFDRFDPQTQARIRSFQDSLITDLSSDSRAAIEATILAGMRLGTDPDDIVRQIRLVIGLTAQQARAVLRYRQQLAELEPGALQRALVSATDKDIIRNAIAGSSHLSASLIDDLTARYEAAYLTYRARTIATTEATRAASMGLEDSYQQAVDRGAMPAEAVRKHWQISLDEKTCEHCLSVVDMNPDGVPLGSSFESDEGPVDAPGLHPNCRCSLELVTDLDMIPDSYVP